MSLIGERRPAVAEEAVGAGSGSGQTGQRNNRVATEAQAAGVGDDDLVSAGCVDFDVNAGVVERERAGSECADASVGADASAHGSGAVDRAGALERGAGGHGEVVEKLARERKRL